MRRLLPAFLLGTLWLVAPLRAEIAVTGSVTATGGAPLAGASVELLPVVSGFESGRLILAGRLEPPAAATARTDDAGRYRLAAPRSGVWKLVVKAAGFVPVQLLHIAVVEPLVIAPAVLTADRGTRVRVTDGAGRPRAGLWVWADATLPPRKEIWRPAFRAGRTDSRGSIALPRAAGERLTIQVLGGGVALASRESGKDEETLQVRPPGEAVGATPRMDSAIRTLEIAGEQRATVLVRTGPLAWPVGFLESGQPLRFADPADGPRTLRLVKADGRRQTVEMPAVAGRDTPWAVTPPPSILFNGRVLDALSRRPIAGAVVWLGADPGTFALTDGEGRYRLTAPADSRFWLQAEAAGYRARATWISPEEAEAGKAPTLGLTAAAKIRGRVLDAADTPLARAWVVAVPRRRAPTSHGAFRLDPADARAPSDAGGAFGLNGLEPGLDYELRISCPGYAAVRLPVTAPAAPGPFPAATGSRSTPEIVVRLSPTRAAYGRVIDDRDRPVAGAEVILTAAGERRPSPGSDEEGSGARGTSDGEGRFTIPAVPAAEVEIGVFRKGFAPLVVRGVEIPVDNGSEPIDLGTVVLATAADLAGRVVDPEGEGMADVPIFVVPPKIPAEALEDHFAQILSRRTPDAHTDAGGGFRLDSFTPGDRVHLLVGGVEHVGVWVKYLDVPLPEPLRVVLEPGLGVVGRVLDAAGQPIPDAELSLAWTERLAGLEVPGLHPGGKTRRGDVDGRFAFYGLRPGEVTLIAWAPGFQESEPRTLEISQEAGREAVEIVLASGATLRGEVRTAGGQPLDGVLVSAGRPGAFSDVEGRFRLDGVTPGMVTVTGYHPSYGALEEETEVEMGEQFLELTYPDGHEVSGNVVGESGRPAAAVALELGAEGRHGSPLYRTRSDAGGAFRLASVATGEYQLKAVLPGSVLKTPRILRVAGEDLEGLRVVLERGALVTGTVEGLDFDELTRLRVRVEDAQSHGIPGEVDYTGVYEVRDVPPGHWVVRADLGGGRRQVQERFEVPPGGAEIRRDLSFAERFVLSGSVLLDGEPLAAARVSLDGRDLAVEREVATDPHGRFRIEDLEPATYNLGVAHSRELVVHNRDVELNGNQDVVIDLVPARVSGRVVDAGSGQGVAGAQVRLVRLSQTGEETNALTAASDAEGGFDIPRAPPGKYRVSVHHDGYAADTWQLELADGAQHRDLELEVRATPGGELRVFLASGGVPRSVDVTVVGADGVASLRQSRGVDADGRVTLHTIPEGSFQVYVQSPGTTVLQGTLEVPGEPLALTLEEAGQLEVRVPDLITSDAVATLELIGADQQPWVGLDPYGQVVDTWALVGGRAIVEGVPAGLWSLRVTTADGKTWSGYANAVAGTRSGVELR